MKVFVNESGFAEPHISEYESDKFMELCDNLDDVFTNIMQGYKVNRFPEGIEVTKGDYYLQLIQWNL